MRNSVIQNEEKNSPTIVNNEIPEHQDSTMITEEHAENSSHDIS